MAGNQAIGSGGSELGRFLRAQRARLSPEIAGLTIGDGLRRTPGLRREELATLAGISIDYYIRLERSKEANPSPPVVDALARALQLDDSEHEFLRDLVARAARGRAEPPVSPSRSVAPGMTLLLESMRPNPAYVVGRTLDVLACNPSGLRLFAGMERWPPERRNIVRFVFRHPDAPDLLDDWDDQIRACVGRLRALAAIEPDAPDLVQLVDDMLRESPAFTRLWDSHDVRPHYYGSKTFHHPDVGDLTLGCHSMQVEGTPGHQLVAYHAEPGTPEYDALVLLDLAASELAAKAARRTWDQDGIRRTRQPPQRRHPRRRRHARLPRLARPP